MARLKQIVIDCNPAVARFWAAALDDFEVRAYDDAECRSPGRTRAHTRHRPPS